VNHRWQIWLIYFLSGFAALVYQVVWMRMLTPVLGCTVYATATVVSSFMFGFALGSHLAGRWSDRREDLLRIYSLLEFGIGLSAFALSHAIPLLGPAYRAVVLMTAGEGWASGGLRFALIFATLIVPTTLMGSTLPVMSRFLNRDEKSFGAYLGWLYGINTLGAVFGSLLTGFVLIAWLGQYATLQVGVTLNMLIGLIAWWAQLRSSRPMTMPRDPQPISGYSTGIRRLSLVCFFFSGGVALAYEVIWTRWLQLIVGTSVYAFTIIVVVFLAGIAIGSTILGSWSDRLRNPLGWFGWTQLIIAGWGALAMVLFTPRDTPGPMFVAELITAVKAASIMMLPITVAFGWQFPIASRCCARTTHDIGSSVGTAYAVNTVGCALGSLAAGFVLIPWLGSPRSLVLLALTNVIVGMLLLFQAYRGVVRRVAMVACCLSVVVLGVGFFVVHRWDPYLVAMRKKYMSQGAWRIYKHVETAAATVTAFGPSRNPAPIFKQLLVNGSGMTSLTTDTKLMAHLPLLAVPDPKRILVICFGMGTTVRSASRHEGLHIRAVELADGVVEMFPYFHLDARSVLARPDVNITIDDGRHYLLTQDELWDVITIDPAPPIHSAGTVNLYTREFMELCRDRLSDRGVVCLWVPPWIDSEVRMIFRTFLDTFPSVNVWGGPSMPGFYLMGSEDEVTVDEARVRAMYENPVLAADLVEWDRSVDSPERLLALRICDRRGLERLADGAPMITDDRPYTEFPMWRVLRGPQPPIYLDAPEAILRITRSHQAAEAQ
jgi:spermidine synthase